MDNAGFIIAAYGLTALFVGGYTLWLHARLRRARTDRERREP